MAKNQFLSKAAYAVFLFCAVFTPDFFPFSIRYLLIMLCGAAIAWKWIRKRRIRINRRIPSVLKGFVPFFVWLIISQAVHIGLDRGNAAIYLETLVHTFSIFLAAFLVGQFLINVQERLELSLDDFVDLVMIVMLVQLVCVVLALLVPAVRSFFNNFTIKNSYSERLKELAKASNSGRIDRSYGLSNNLFDSFGFITALMITLLFAAGMQRKNTLFMILSAVMLLMPLVNARTGLLLALIGMMMTSLFFSDVKIILRNVGIMLLAIAAFILLLDRLPPSMVQWLRQGIQEARVLLGGSGDTVVYSKLFSADMVFPSSILLGGGGRPKELISYGVDNGYVNCIWYFGLIGTALLLGGYYRMFRMVYKRGRDKMKRAAAASFGTMFFIYLLKVYSLDNFGGIVLVFGVSFLLLAYSREGALPAGTEGRGQP